MRHSRALQVKFNSKISRLRRDMQLLVEVKKDIEREITAAKASKRSCLKAIRNNNLSDRLGGAYAFSEGLFLEVDDIQARVGELKQQIYENSESLNMVISIFSKYAEVSALFEQAEMRKFAKSLVARDLIEAER